MTSPAGGLDARNAAFWNELCGSGLARALGISTRSPESLARFDAAYLGLYPYLAGYVEAEDLRAGRVLEIGLGYGTLGTVLAGRAREYHGVDVAPGPVEMMRYRLALAGGGRGTACVASALALPYGAGTFQHVYSIGCLHHTGDLPRAVSEIHRVLVPGGTAIVMLYHRHSFRLLTTDPRRWWGLGADGAARTRALYDTNARGEPAPHTDFVSRREARALFGAFRQVRVDVQNFDGYALGGRLVVRRERLLGNVARVLGLDLYVVAVT